MIWISYIFFCAFLLAIFYLYFTKEKTAQEPPLDNAKRKNIFLLLTGFFSVAFFIFEVIFLNHYQNKILFRMSVSKQDFRLVQAENRRFLYYQIARLHSIQREGISPLVILGGSSAREYFWPDDVVSKELKRKVINLGSPRQGLIDTLRLADSVKQPGSVIVYVLREGKFLSFDSEKILNSYFITGSEYPYYLPSSASENFIKNHLGNELKIRDIRTQYRLVPSINPYAFFIVEYFNFIRGQLEEGRFRELFTDTRPLVHNRDIYRTRVRRKTLTKRGQKAQPVFDIPDEAEEELSDNELKRTVRLNFELLQNITDLCKERNMRFILLDLPQPQSNPYFLNALDEYKNKNPEVTHIPIPQNMLVREDQYFADVNHLNDEGRKFYFPFVIRKLRETLK